MGLENVPTAFDEQQKIYSSGSVTVIRVRLVGELPNGTTATDLDLKVTQVPLFTTKNNSTDLGHWSVLLIFIDHVVIVD
ncbi:hypothetical protein FB379_13932 [Aeribacillus composti]|nr:hypothetical protein FB379_13932 [Aeribacillus composti]